MPMAEIVAGFLSWVVPALVVFGVAAIAIAAIAWAIRAARRSPRARAEADRIRAGAGATLVKLDDAVDELDLEVGLSGALYGGGSPAWLPCRWRSDASRRTSSVGAPTHSRPSQGRGPSTPTGCPRTCRPLRRWRLRD